MADWGRWVEQLKHRNDLTNRRFMLIGIEECGKASLLRQWLSDDNVDGLMDEETVALAELAPARFMCAFVEGGKEGLADVQRSLQLTNYLKRAENLPETFGITASVNIEFPDSMQTIRLRPLTEGEIQGRPPHLIERLLNGELQELPDSESESSLRTILNKAVLGGFPGSLHLNFRQRSRWYRGWTESLFRQNLPALGSYRQLSLLEKMLGYCACHSSEVINSVRMAENLGKTRVVTNKYFEAVRRLFVVDKLLAWSDRADDWSERTPKLMFCDSGFVSWQANVRQENLENLVKEGERQGVAERIVKTWIYQQLVPLTDVFGEWHLYHYRSYKGQTVDFLFERDDGVLIGFAVRLKESVSAEDLKGLRWFRKRYGEKRRIVTVLLYAGSCAYPCDDDEYVLPMSFLWL